MMLSERVLMNFEVHEANYDLSTLSKITISIQNQLFSLL